MNSMKNNKRASIPITILVLGVFAVCGLALITFTFFGYKSGPLIAETIEGINTDVEKFYFYTSDIVGDSLETAIKKIKINEEDDISIEGDYLVIKRKYVAPPGESILDLVKDSDDSEGKSILELIEESKSKSLVVEFTYREKIK